MIEIKIKKFNLKRRGRALPITKALLNSPALPGLGMKRTHSMKNTLIAMSTLPILVMIH